MLKKVSENIINLLKYYGYQQVNYTTFEEFICDKVPAEISGLVNDNECKHIQIDHKLLDNLEDVIDELNDYLVDEIDLGDINKRLS